LKNLLDVAVLQMSSSARNFACSNQYENIDEIPFDFVRRRLSVILSHEDGTHVLTCKGAIEEVFAVCKHYELCHELGTLDPTQLAAAQAKTAELNDDGFRVVAVAYKEIPDLKKSYSVEA
jgi:Mg2+-importing ATPase